MKIINSALFFYLLSIHVVFANFARADEQLLVDPVPRQQISGWGITAGPLDWDGNSMFRDASTTRTFFLESGVNVVRIVLDGSLYRQSTNGLNTVLIDNSVIPQVQRIIDGHVDSYVVSFISPPSVMRVYRSNDYAVHLDKNPLRIEREDDYIAFFVKLLSYIRDKSLPLPLAVSLQIQPDVPPPAYFGSTSMPGCVYSVEQWSRLVGKARKALDQGGFSSVEIIGPETYGFEWLFGIRNNTSNLSGLAFAKSPIRATAKLDYEAIEKLLQTEKWADKKVWVLGSNPAGVLNDREQLLITFQDIKEDLIRLRTNYWFFRYAFTWESGAESLVHGHAQVETPIYHALKTLWHVAPPGSTVHAVIQPYLPGGEEKAIDMHSFALIKEKRFAVIATNELVKERTVALSGLDFMTGSISSYTAAGESVFQAASAKNSLVLKLPPSSVSIIEGELK